MKKNKIPCSELILKINKQLTKITKGNYRAAFLQNVISLLIDTASVDLSLTMPQNRHMTLIYSINLKYLKK